MGTYYRRMERPPDRGSTGSRFQGDFLSIGRKTRKTPSATVHIPMRWTFMSKSSTSTPKVPSYSIPQGCVINIKTGESRPYGAQQIPEALFQAVLADAAQFLGYTLHRKGGC
jgi:hypothetical protein